jgi:hypothetical protein
MGLQKPPTDLRAWLECHRRLAQDTERRRCVDIIRAQIGSSKYGSADYKREREYFNTFLLRIVDLIERPTGERKPVLTWQELAMEWKREAQIYRRFLSEAGVLYCHPTDADHREWWSGGAWLYPGDAVVVIDHAAITVADRHCIPRAAASAPDDGPPGPPPGDESALRSPSSVDAPQCGPSPARDD